MLRPPLPHPRGLAPRAQTWPLIFNKRPYLPPRVGGCVRRGAPSPCPRLPAPPKSLRRAFEMSHGGLLRRLAANSATARRRYMRRSRLLRPVCALLAWLIVAALSSAEMPPYGRLGGSPCAPAPCVRALQVALLPSAPSLPLPRGRAAARPHALAGCFGGLLCSRPSMVAPSLSAVRPTGGRTLVRAPLGLLRVDALLSRYAYGLAVRYAPRIASGWTHARSHCRVRCAAASVKQPLKTGYRPLFNLK